MIDLILGELKGQSKQSKSKTPSSFYDNSGWSHMEEYAFRMGIEMSIKIVEQYKNKK